MKKLLKHIFDLIGLEVKKKHSLQKQFDYFRNEQMIGALARQKIQGLMPGTIIDIGAASGSWSLSAAEFWPYAKYVLFEPLEERKAELIVLESKYQNFHIVQAAAGNETGTVSFNVSSDLDGSGVTSNADLPNARTVKVTSVDLELKRLQLKGPYIVKLDTHGFEVPILEGCKQVWNDISLFIIECYGFEIVKDCLLFWQMCRYMDERGFRLIDVVDVVNRSKDGAFWQCDAFFAPKTLPLFMDNSYL